MDVAFRSGDTDDELVGRKIADSIWAVYASHGYIERHGKPERVEDLSQHHLVGFDEKLANHRAANWLKEVAPDAKMSARSNSVLGLVSAVKSGVGVGPLPTALGDAEPDLVRVLGPDPGIVAKLAVVDASRHPPRAAYCRVLRLHCRTARRAEIDPDGVRATALPGPLLPHSLPATAALAPDFP